MSDFEVAFAFNALQFIDFIKDSTSGMLNAPFEPFITANNFADCSVNVFTETLNSSFPPEITTKSPFISYSEFPPLSFLIILMIC